MSIDTTAINRSNGLFGTDAELWLFGYGSLIWRADFDYAERRPARLRDWSRRFWQGSHDHRGTPEAPGRVLTLVAEPGAVCDGVAYRITATLLDQLDQREKNGYLRFQAPLGFGNGETAHGLVYIAADTNSAWLGPAPETEIARHVADAVGPSGRNRDYVLRLAEALRDLGAIDDHVFAVERHLLALDAAHAEDA